MKFRFTAEDFEKLLDYSDSFYVNTAAMEIANALLEKWEAESRKITLLADGRPLCLHTVLSEETCSNVQRAILWNPKPINRTTNT